MEDFSSPTVLELCAGAGGQALGLEQAGFACSGAVENDAAACKTLLRNRPHWNVLQEDLKHFNGDQFEGVDLVAAGVPCPPFSIAGRQLGADDERDLFPHAMRVVRHTKPRAVLFENVRGFASAKFESYRARLQQELLDAGYVSDYRVLNASDFGVPQLRPRFVLVALRREYADHFFWPATQGPPPTVAEKLAELMAANGWKGVRGWRRLANSIAPTLVGGSKKHGGPDLGPTRAKARWRELGVDAMGLADQPPGRDFPVNGLPKLTVAMAASLQGFPTSWFFVGGKTASYRQVGNAFPPPVAKAVGIAIREALAMTAKRPKSAPRMPSLFGLDTLDLGRRTA